MKLKDAELKSILDEVEQEITTLLKSEGAALRKAKGEEPGEEPGGDDGGEGSAPAGGGAPPAGGAPEGSAPAGGGAPEGSAPAGGGAPPMDGAPDGAAPGGDPAMEQGPLDPEALKAEYVQLGQQNPEELKVHYMACKAALFELMQGGADPAGGADPGGAPGGAPGPEASAPAPSFGKSEREEKHSTPCGSMTEDELREHTKGCGVCAREFPEFDQSKKNKDKKDKTAKAEVPASMKNLPANGGTQKAAVPDAITKSESDKRIEDLEEQVDGLVKALELTLGQPVRKAITSITHVPRDAGSGTAEPPKRLTKAEVKERIDRKLSEGKLSKSDRGKLVSFSMGNLAFDDIADILK